MQQDHIPATQSPCIGLCNYNNDQEVCRGCGRTVEEVINWHTFDDEQKIAINQRLKQTSTSS